MPKKIICLIFILPLFFITKNIQAQSATDKVTTDTYSPDMLGELIAGEVGKYRLANKMDSMETDDVLTSAAGDQAIYMAKNGIIGLEQNKSAKKTTGKRVRYYGGSTEGSEEVGVYVTPGKGKEQFTYEKVAKDAVDKIVKNKKLAAILMKAEYIYVGAAAAMDETGKKIFVSIVVGTELAITPGK